MLDCLHQLACFIRVVVDIALIHMSITRDGPLQMDVHNLAIMFGPTLVRPQDSSILVMARDNADQCRIVESIISHVCHYISSVCILVSTIIKR